MAEKQPAREMRFMANPSTGNIEVVLLYDGLVHGSIVFTQEQAEGFARQFVEAIEMVNRQTMRRPPAGGKSSLIIPERVN